MAINLGALPVEVALEDPATAALAWEPRFSSLGIGGGTVRAVAEDPAGAAGGTSAGPADAGSAPGSPLDGAVLRLDAHEAVILRAGVAPPL